MKERYNFLAVTQEWPIIELTNRFHNHSVTQSAIQNTFEGKMQTILEKAS